MNKLTLAKYTVVILVTAAWIRLIWSGGGVVNLAINLAATVAAAALILRDGPDQAG